MAVPLGLEWSAEGRSEMRTARCEERGTWDEGRGTGLGLNLSLYCLLFTIHYDLHWTKLLVPLVH